MPVETGIVVNDPMYNHPPLDQVFSLGRTTHRWLSGVFGSGGIELVDNAPIYYDTSKNWRMYYDNVAKILTIKEFSGGIAFQSRMISSAGTEWIDFSIGSGAAATNAIQLVTNSGAQFVTLLTDRAVGAERAYIQVLDTVSNSGLLFTFGAGVAAADRGLNIVSGGVTYRFLDLNRKFYTPADQGVEFDAGGASRLLNYNSVNARFEFTGAPVYVPELDLPDNGPIYFDTLKTVLMSFNAVGEGALRTTGDYIELALYANAVKRYCNIRSCDIVGSKYAWSVITDDDEGERVSLVLGTNIPVGYDKGIGILANGAPIVNIRTVDVGGKHQGFYISQDNTAAAEYVMMGVYEEVLDAGMLFQCGAALGAAQGLYIINAGTGYRIVDLSRQFYTPNKATGGGVELNEGGVTKLITYNAVSAGIEIPDKMIMPTIAPAAMGEIGMDAATGRIQMYVGAAVRNCAYVGEAMPPIAHDILSASHGDTLAGVVVQGDVIVGNATPKWSRLAANAAATNMFLRSVSGGIPSWSQVAWGDLSGVPATFPPSAHALAGVLHTSGNWKVYYSDGAGLVTELALGAAGTILTSSGPAAAPTFAAAAGGGFALPLINSFSIGGAATNYVGSLNLSSTDANVQQKLPACTVKRFRFRVTFNSGTANAVFTVRKNGADQTMTVIVAAGVTGWQETVANPVTFVDGDLLSIKVDTTLYGGAENISVTCMEVTT
jgi:hypothetical protein